MSPSSTTGTVSERGLRMELMDAKELAKVLSLGKALVDSSLFSTLRLLHSTMGPLGPSNDFILAF